ncbi:MAG: hypothetical protein PHN88_14225 [Ignavibacteria bacterium]|nr:hypothetical protein [Ignavibacteria bacterium]
MERKQEIQLLNDILKCINKYESKTLIDLLHLLNEDNFFKTITATLDKLSLLNRNTKKIKTGNNNSELKNPIKFLDTLVEIGRYDKEKADILTELYYKIKQKEILVSLREMKNFVLDSGLPPLKTTSREKAIIPFLKILLTLNIDDLKNKIEKIYNNSTKQDRSLKGWSDIILKNDSNE